MKTHTYKSYSTDSKIKYGSSSLPSFSEIPREEIDPQAMRFFEEYDRKLEEKFGQRKRKQTNTESRLQNDCYERAAKLKRSFTTKSVVLLTMFVVISIIAIFYELNLNFGPDEDCWEEFKNSKCDLGNPYSHRCLKLYQCMSGENLQFSVAYIIGFFLTSWAAFRFRNQLKLLALRAFELVDKFTENK